MQITTEERRPVRSNRLLLRKYAQYLIPTMITYAALSLNEFVDSMLVSNLLGSEAMAIVNLGMPLMLVMAALYALLGSGGATVYAISAGKHDRETAGRSLTASLAAALVTGLLLLLIGAVFSSPLTRIMCGDAAQQPTFEAYLRVLALSAPFEVLILTFVSFLPAAGYPGFSTAVNVIANVVNIGMDYVYIRICGMGVEGAAWATLTGYACAGLVVAFAIASRRMKVHFSRHLLSSLASVGEIFRLGRPDALNQVGLSIQFAVCNSLAMASAGMTGVIAFSLCIQVTSIVSVFIGAVIGSSIPMLAVLHGQRDYSGEAGILKVTVASGFGVGTLGMIAFELFAPQLAALYNITQAAQLALAVYAVRAFALMLMPRDIIVLYYRYLKLIGLNRYSTAVSALDSFAAVIPTAWILVTVFGIKGLFWAFPVASSLLLAAVLLCNRMYEKKSGGRLKGVLLIETDEDARPVLDVTITRDSAEIAAVSETLQRVCEENGLETRDAMRAALAVEEIAVYAANRKSPGSHADLLVRISQGNVEIDFRCLGEAFNLAADAETDSKLADSIRLLRGIAACVDHEYLLGMNSTRIVIEGCKAVAAE